MTDILRQDEGWFICQASNSQGQNEARVYLEVIEVPGFKSLNGKIQNPRFHVGSPSITVFENY